MNAPRTWLTIDQGNTCLDAVLFDVSVDARVIARWSDLDRQDFAQLRDAHGKPEGVSFCSVRGAQEAAALGADLEAVLGSATVPDCGLVIDVDQPEQVGRDRLFAARGAHQLCSGAAAIVVDVGTAMTVDLVHDGHFLGGAIAPGPGLLCRALDQGGAQLFEVAARPGARALGKNTRAALEAGVVIGLRGAARALVDGLLEEAPDARLYVTGGARSLLLEPVGCLGADKLVEVPDLVHLGLVSAAGFGLARG